MQPLYKNVAARNALLCFLFFALWCPQCSGAQNAPAPTPEVQALLDKAKASAKQGKTGEAIGWYEQAILAARERKDTAGEAEALAPLITLGADIFLAAPGKGQPQPALPATLATLEQGHAKQKEARLLEAARLYEQALQTAREQNDRTGEALSLTYLARLSLFESSLPRPQGYYTRALPLYRELNDPSSQANYLFYLGIGAVSSARPEPGLLLFNAALQRYQSIGEKEGVALTFDLMGITYDAMGQWKKALPYYEKSLPIHKETGDRYRQAQTLLSISKSLLEVRELAKAMIYVQEGRQLAEEMGDKKSEGKFLLNIATIKDVSGETRAALDAYTECLPFLEATGDTRGVAFCYYNMEIIYSRIGSYLKALDMQERSLSLFRKLEYQHGIVGSLNGLGLFYLQVNQTDRALAYFQEALQANERNLDLTDQAMTLSNLAETYGKLDRRREERASLEQALQLYRKAEDPYGEANALRALSANYLAVGEGKQALAYAEQAQQRLHKIGDKSSEAVALSLKGDCLVEDKQFAAAAECYRQALQLCQETEFVVGEAGVLANLGTLETMQGHYEEAALFYAQALTLLERLRANLGDLTQAKLGYIQSHFATYQRYQDVLLQNRQEAQAFQWGQRAKARVLVDLMEAGNMETRPTLTAQEAQKATELKRRDRELSRQWLNALGAVDALKREAQASKAGRDQAEKQLRAIQQQQKQLEHDWNKFSDAISLRNPQESQKRAARTVTLEEAAALLTEEDALLEYAIIKQIRKGLERDELILYVTTKEKGKPRLSVYRLPSDINVLSRLTREFREACAGRPDSTGERPYQNLARQLYRQLIAPAEAVLARKRHLILCPDGPLWEVPFQALLLSGTPKQAKTKSARAEFLWERYAISYAYSATGLKAALSVRQRPNRPQAQKTLLVMANPDFGQGSAPVVQRAPRPSERGPALLLRGSPLSPLPNTLVEATAIRDCFPNATVKSGKDAQEELLKSTGGDYRYLHLATHGITNDSAPMLSGVALAQPPAKSQEDGILTAREMFDLSLGAEMVVLSACETARGAKRTGEGIIGVTWALFAAGVPTQVVSQWAVDDAATAQLMGNFYRSLKQGKSKAASLRAAGLALLRDGKHGHPFYWAPFLLMGDWH